jgi:hypothetical protein
MNLFTTFFGHTVEGDFETSDDNWDNEKLLRGIKNAFYEKVNEINAELEKEIGIPNPDWKGIIFSFKTLTFEDRYLNKKEMQTKAEQKAIELGFKRPVYTENKSVYETPTHRAVVTTGKDIAGSYTKLVTRVDIYIAEM